MRMPKRYSISEVMFMGYTQNDIIERCRAAMFDVGSFYKQDFINYRGTAADTKRLYTEIIAEFIVNILMNLKIISHVLPGKAPIKLQRTAENSIPVPIEWKKSLR